MEAIEFKWPQPQNFRKLDEPSQFLIKVTEGFDYEDVDGFTMGIRIFYQ